MKGIINIIFLFTSIGAIFSIIGFYIFNSKYINKLRENSLCINLEEENFIVIDKYIKDKSELKNTKSNYNYENGYTTNNKNKKNNKKKEMKGNNSDIYYVIFQNVDEKENKIIKEVTFEEYKKTFFGDRISNQSLVYKNKDENIFFKVTEKSNLHNLNMFYSCPDDEKNFFQKNKDIILEQCEEFEILRKIKTKNTYKNIFIILIISIILFIFTL